MPTMRIEPFTPVLEQLHAGMRGQDNHGVAVREADKLPAQTAKRPPEGYQEGNWYALYEGERLRFHRFIDNSSARVFAMSKGWVLDGEVSESFYERYKNI